MHASRERDRRLKKAITKQQQRPSKNDRVRCRHSTPLPSADPRHHPRHLRPAGDDDAGCLLHSPAGHPTTAASHTRQRGHERRHDARSAPAADHTHTPTHPPLAPHAQRSIGRRACSHHPQVPAGACVSIAYLGSCAPASTASSVRGVRPIRAAAPSEQGEEAVLGAAAQAASVGGRAAPASTGTGWMEGGRLSIVREACVWLGCVRCEGMRVSPGPEGPGVIVSTGTGCWGRAALVSLSRPLLWAFSCCSIDGSIHRSVGVVVVRRVPKRRRPRAPLAPVQRLVGAVPVQTVFGVVRSNTLMLRRRPRPNLKERPQAAAFRLVQVLNSRTAWLSR